MPIERNAIDRIADWFRRGGQCTYRISIKPHIAPKVLSLIDKLVDDGDDGQTTRISLFSWRMAERPLIAVHRGDVSTCRIDGPWQPAAGGYIPIGGLVRSPGITWHLTPFEALALHKHMQKVIDDAVCNWINLQGPEMRCHGPVEINRDEADRNAKAMIAQSEIERHQVPSDSDHGPEETSRA